MQVLRQLCCFTTASLTDDNDNWILADDRQQLNKK